MEKVLSFYLSTLICVGGDWTSSSYTITNYIIYKKLQTFNSITCLMIFLMKCLLKRGFENKSNLDHEKILNLSQNTFNLKKFI